MVYFCIYLKWNSLQKGAKANHAQQARGEVVAEGIREKEQGKKKTDEDRGRGDESSTEAQRNLSSYKMFSGANSQRYKKRSCTGAGRLATRNFL